MQKVYYATPINISFEDCYTKRILFAYFFSMERFMNVRKSASCFSISVEQKPVQHTSLTNAKKNKSFCNIVYAEGH